MNHTTLSTTGLKVSRLCFGTMTFGGQTDEPTAVRMIEKCIGAQPVIKKFTVIDEFCVREYIFHEQRLAPPGMRIDEIWPEAMLFLESKQGQSRTLAVQEFKLRCHALH